MKGSQPRSDASRGSTLGRNAGRLYVRVAGVPFLVDIKTWRANGQQSLGLQSQGPRERNDLILGEVRLGGLQGDNNPRSADKS